MVSELKVMKAVVIEGDRAVVSSSVPVPPLAKDMLRIKVKAVAVNPTDWKHVSFKIGPQGSILGCDVAGEIVEVGADVKNFKVGEVVYSAVHGASVKHPENGGFAEYSLLDPQLTLKVPGGGHLSGKDSIPLGPVQSIEGAVSLPVSLITAGLVFHYHLGLKTEWQPRQVQVEKPLLIWGGATAVGQMLIQLAKKLNGYSKIIVVASRKHEQQLKSLGADELFDYHDEDVVEQIKSKHKDLPYLIDAVSSAESFVNVYRLGNTDKPTKLIQLTTMSEEQIPEKERNPHVKVEGAVLYLITGLDVPFGRFNLPADPACRAAAIEFVRFIGPKVADGEINHIPLKVFHNGLEDIPVAMNKIKNGENSNVKYIVTLQ
ncbi:hypothetical protein HG536_0D02950 [Torulaspora globosa]|uniref:Enoyl reductase (ER) domain-containing protein n=1 Tax=Torulaspora globosa TaxID=48254 RepID=A0A7G3ZGY7_9SACH|nr:uncharacterized protein HG536_0D02950 [Torulaspora globosa]QLL32773.1 hypothetical protein HG536_0D02950 [Torulaspora globosa]